MSAANIQNAKSASTATFVTALSFNIIVFVVELGIFTYIRPYFRAIYEPRTYIPEPDKRVRPLSEGLFLWPLTVFRTDYRAIISANGLDAYFLVRFLRVMATVFVPIWLISWLVLLPATSVHTSVIGLSGLDRYTFGNVAPDKQTRYATHLICVYGFTFWIFHNIRREMRHFIITRQQHLIERIHAKSVQANTILITGIPKKYLSQDALFKLFNALPGGVKKIWINRDLKGLPDIYNRRMAACEILESAESGLLRTAAKLRLQSTESARQDAPSESRDIESGPIQQAEVAVPESERPTHKLGFLRLFGEKVDSIRWARDEIALCTRLLDEGRLHLRASQEHGSVVVEEYLNDKDEFLDAAVDAEGKPRLQQSEAFVQVQDLLSPVKAGKQAVSVVGNVAKGTVGEVVKGAEKLKARVVRSEGPEGEYPPMSSAFITFNRQISAHLAEQVLTHHEPYRMSSKYIEVAPTDVIWENLALNPYEQKIRVAIGYAVTAGLIILWAFPVAFVGIISNVQTICTTVKFLAWICKLPSVVVGIISGILPPVLLSALMLLLPIILRLLARFEGTPQYTGLELSLMSRYFMFQVLHSFLIVTFSSGIIASLDDLIHSPTSIPTILARNLPKASTFFLTYFVLQGLSGVAGGFLQIVPLGVYYFKLFILASTPRSVWIIKYVPRSVEWGTVFPGVTLLVVIALGYSIISPIINGLACATFFMLYQLYKYLFLYAYQQPTTTDTGGMFYPKAIQHIFVGLYVQQICLCALFFLARNENRQPSALAEGGFMVILIAITAGFHIIMNHSYNPLLSALPLSLQDRTYTEPVVRETPAAFPDQEQAGPSRASEGGDELKPKDAADREAELLEESYGFVHPAASRPQRTVWIPRDALGLAEEEERECREKGVVVGDVHATMDVRGRVHVSGGPPDLISSD